MRKVPARPCPAAGCGSLLPCAQHAKKQWRPVGHQPFARTHPYAGGRRWQATRRRILKRDNYRCTYCGCEATVIDHIVCRAAGGDDSDSNLVAACGKCNQIKAQAEARRGRGLATRGRTIMLMPPPEPEYRGKVAL